MSECDINEWTNEDLIDYLNALKTTLEGGEDTLFPLIEEEIEPCSSDEECEDKNLNWKENEIWLKVKINEIEHILEMRNPPVVPLVVPTIIGSYNQYIPDILPCYKSIIDY